MELGTLGDPSPAWPFNAKPAMWTNTGSFGAPRPSSLKPTRHHQGIDLYASAGTPVLAMEDGVIDGDQGWSGEGTRAVWVRTPTGLSMLYGAVAPGSYGSKGTKVTKGQPFALVGVYPQGSTMLHLELWTSTKIPRPRWNYEQAPPSTLIDPASYLQRIFESEDVATPSLPPTQHGGKGGAAAAVLSVAAVAVASLLLVPRGRARKPAFW